MPRIGPYGFTSKGPFDGGCVLDYNPKVGFSMFQAFVWCLN